MKLVIGIDPGFEGAIVMTDGIKFLQSIAMPLLKYDSQKRVHFQGVYDRLKVMKLKGAEHVFLERAIPMAQGAKSAFNYGRGFEALVLAVELLKIPVTHIEPQKWAKVMHEGISSDLKPKAKSLIAVQRLYPQLVEQLPTKPKGALMDGPVDALLIAGFGLRNFNNKSHNIGDFY